MIKITTQANFEKIYKKLNRISKKNFYNLFDKYAKKGVEALASATPKRTGRTAESWTYTIKETKRGIEINWTNTNVNEGIPIALVLQYGHATVDGHFIEGVDYINPALVPIFDELGREIEREVSLK